MTGPIDIAYVEIRPDTRGFGAETKRAIRRELAAVEGEVAVAAGTRGTTSGAAGAAAATAGIRGADRELTDMRRTIGGIDRDTKAASRSLTLMGGSAARAGAIGGAGIAAGIGAGIGIAAVQAAQASISFEDSFAGVRKTVDGSKADLDAIGESFIDLSTKIPIAVEELNAIGAEAGALGIEKDAIVDFTDTVARLGVTTNLASDVAADALARIANITRLPQTQFDNLGATVVDLGNKTAATESEIVDFGLRIAGAGKTIGLSTAEILGFGAALASTGLNAELGGTAISTTFVKIATAVEKGGDDLEAFARVAGQSGDEFAKSFAEDPAEAVISFIEGIGRIKEEGGSVFATLKDLGFSGTRLRDTLLRAGGAGDLLRDSVVTANSAFEANSALLRESEIRFGTTASKIQLMRNSVNALAIDVGDALEPAIEDVADGLAGLALDLRDSEQAGETAASVFETIKDSFAVAGKVLAGSGDDIRQIFTDLAEVVRVLFVTFKPLVVLVGAQFVASIRGAIVVTSLFAKTARLLADVWVATVDAIITAVDKFLGLLSTTADLANRLVPGNPFAGFSDGVDDARERLRGFRDDLKGVDGTKVETEVVLKLPTPGTIEDFLSSLQTEAARAAAPPSVRGTAGQVDASGAVAGSTDVPKVGSDVPEAIAVRNQRLQDQIEIARLQTLSLADDRKALRALAEFSRQQAENDALKPRIRRQFLIQALQAEDDLANLEKTAREARQQKRDEDARQRQADAATAEREREAVLAANLRLARASENTVRDDRVALRAIVKHYKERLAIVGAATAAGRSALAEIRDARAELRAIREQEREDRLDETLDRLKDNTTLASLTRNAQADDERALRAEISFYRARVKEAKKGTAERRKWLIELRRAQNTLADVIEEQRKGAEKTSGLAAEAFSFMQTQTGFTSRLFGNLIPGFAAAGTVGSVTGAAEASRTGLPTVDPNEGRPQDARAATGPRETLDRAYATTANRGMTEAQAAQLVAISRSTLNVLTDIKRGGSHPEATAAARSDRYIMDVV